jgi:hypothetical protein
MFKRFWGFVILLALLISCSPSLTLKSDYFNNGKTLGILVLTGQIEYSNIRLDKRGRKLREGRISSLGYTPISLVIATNYMQNGAFDGPPSIISRPQFLEILDNIDNDVDPTEKVSTFFIEEFNEKRKKVKFIGADLDYELSEIPDFESPNGRRIYFNKDVRYMKDKYQIDELLILRIRYGVTSIVVEKLETSRDCFTSISATTINLDDNSIIYSNLSTGSVLVEPLNLDNPSIRENLKKGLLISTDSTLNTEERFFSKFPTSNQ